MPWRRSRRGGSSRTRSSTTTSPRWRSIRTIRSPNTLWAGTGEPNACGSGCTAGVGLYRTTNGGKSWKGPIGAAQFAGRAVGSIAVQPGNSNVIFAASGRGVLGVSNTCCGGVDALIPGAPHFGLYRSTNGGVELEARQPGRAGAVHGVDAGPGVAEPDGVLAARRAPRDVRPGGPEHGLRVVLRARHLAIARSRATRGSRSCRASARPPAPPSGPEFDVVQLGGETRMYVGRRRRRRSSAHFRRNDAVRNAAAATARSLLDRPHQQQRGQPARLLQLRLLRRPMQLRQLRLRPAGRRPGHGLSARATTITTRTTTSPGGRTAAPFCCRPTPACTSPT